ncbi:MAG: hypothetical protein AB8G14_18665 [Ilumatobacter sp.]
MCAGTLVATAGMSAVADGVVAAAPSTPCTVSQTLTAGVDDNYATANGAEASQRSALHQSFWQVTHPAGVNLPFKDYDDPTNDAWLAESFEGITVPAGHQICAATLEFAARGIGAAPDNDSIGIHFIVDTGSGPERLANATWGENILSFETAPGEYGAVLDLDDLFDPTPPEPTSVLAQMQERGFLDVWIQDDTEVDFLELTISTQPVISIVKTTNGVDEAQVPIGGAVTWTYTIANNAENPAIVSELVDDQEGEIDLDTCEPGNGVIGPGETMVCTLTGYATSADYCNTAIATGQIEGGDEFEISDRSCYSLIETACEGNLITNPKFDDVNANPDAAADEDIDIAAGWGPIWTKAGGASTGDVFGVGQWSASQEPTPASGNYGTFWTNKQDTRLVFREGIMNQLKRPLRPGATTLSFTTAQIFPGVSELAVYGVVRGSAPFGTTPSSWLAPENVDLFGSVDMQKNVVLLGTVPFTGTEDNHKILRTIPINALQSFDRIFLTHSDESATSGKAFVAVDDFCMLPTTGPGEEPAVAALAKPERLMDTRPTGETEDGVAAAEGRLGSTDNNPFGNGVYRLEVAGRSGIDADARAAALNVTVVAPEGRGYLSIFPCNGETPTPPNASSLNFGDDTRVVANNVTAALDGDGDVCIFSNVEAHIVVDAAGYYTPDSGYEAVVPQRFVDTRSNAQPADVVPGGVIGVGNAAARDVLEIDVAGLGDVPDGAAAVVLNVAAVRADAQGFMTIYPCGNDRPNASSLNFSQGANVANGVVVGLSEGDGTVCIFTNVQTEIIVDVGGYYPAGSGFVATEPARFLDTRTVEGANTFDGEFQGAGVVNAGTGVTLDLDREGTSVGTESVALNVTAVRPRDAGAEGFPTSGFISVTPGECVEGAVPETSNLNVSRGDIVRANGVLVSLPVTGLVCVFTSLDADLVVDVSGYFGTGDDWATGFEV